MFPCVALVAVFDDAIRTSLLAHFSAHLKGDIPTHVQASWRAMMADARHAGSKLRVSLFGGLREWGDGRSEQLAKSIAHIVGNTAGVTLSTDGLFQGIRQVAVDCSSGTVSTDETVNALFPGAPDDEAMKKRIHRLYAHSAARPSLPLLKHNPDGRTIPLAQR